MMPTPISAMVLSFVRIEHIRRVVAAHRLAISDIWTAGGDVHPAGSARPPF
jgi:hypothetical protein